MKRGSCRCSKHNLATHFSQTVPKVIVFATPANEVFVKPIDEFKIVSRNAEIATHQIRFCWVPAQSVREGFAVQFGQMLKVAPVGPIGEYAAINIFKAQLA